MFNTIVILLVPTETLLAIHNNSVSVLLMISTILILFISVNFFNFFSRNYILYSIFNLPGTILHELMHFLVGLILFATPKGFSLIPKRIGDSITMGSVSFVGLTIFNRIPTAMAPLLLLPISLLIMEYFSTILIGLEPNLKSILLSLFFGYILYVTIISSIPSITDFKVAFQSLLFIPLILIISYYYLKDTEIYNILLKLISN
jgi:hypothetical protein